MGGIGLRASDVVYGIIQLNGAWRVGTPVDLGWVAFYVGWGLAALHPSMRQLTEPKVIRHPRDRIARLIWLGVASLIAPTLLAIEVLSGAVQDGLAIAVLSAVLSILVLTRLGHALRVQRRSFRRERALRRAGAALLSATNAEEVSRLVADAASQLLPRRRPSTMVLDLADPAAVRESGRADGNGHGNGGARRGQAEPTPEMVYTATLPTHIAQRLAGFEVTLRCDLPAARGRAGTLYLAAEETVLVPLQEAASVLAGQAGQTMQRIALTAEINRRDSEAYFRTLVLNTADVILILDMADRIRYASPSAGALFETDDVTGAALDHLVEPASRHEVHKRLSRVRRGEPDQRGLEWQVRRPRAGEALVEATCRDLRGEPTVDGVVVTLRDVTESRRMQDELYRRATYDSLTGLPNRDVFLLATQRSIDQSRLDGGRAGVVVTQLDDFKLVNNTMGHHAGDELLAMVGRRLAAAMRDQPLATPINGAEWTVARLGGDEFGTCIAGVADQRDIDRVVSAVMQCFREPFALDHGAVTLGASIGVAMSHGGTDSRELLRQADLALSFAKDAGKGRVTQYEESLHTLVVDRMQLRGDLERAVAEGAFRLEYQPIVELPWQYKSQPADGPERSQRTAGFEALIRWHHPERGPLSPAQFIALAEESGLIVPLGRWVLHHAIRTAAGWPGGREHGPYVSVNVSARQLRDPGFVGLVRDELAASGLPPQRLVIEITESLLARGGGVADELARLRADGVRIAIDDFGTGFSSLSYLRQLPVDVIKLDKSFVDTVAVSSEQYAVIATVTQLARTLKLDVVAEGIETEDELDVLSTVGCGYGQGYVVSRPMSHDDAVRWLAKEFADSPNAR